MLQVNFHPFPQIITNRLLLREISRTDVTEMFNLRSSENIMQFIDRPRAITKEDALCFIDVIKTALAKDEGITWAITFKNNPKLIGTIGFWRMQKENYRAEIGYMLHDLFHRQGIMQEAIAAVLRYGFDVLKLHSIEANLNPANIASAKLLEKNNFVLEAHFKENYYFNGRFLDSLVYSLLSKNLPRTF
jgi:ribosomal-protein-alanine N-acetyltransferase